jgi:hypothetical protein
MGLYDAEIRANGFYMIGREKVNEWGFRNHVIFEVFRDGIDACKDLVGAVHFIPKIDIAGLYEVGEELHKS